MSKQQKHIKPHLVPASHCESLTGILMIATVKKLITTLSDVLTFDV